MELKPLIQSVKIQGKYLLVEAWKTSLILIKIVIPISIITKLMNDCGIITYIGLGLGPVMKCVGLPGSMGLVWATAMITAMKRAFVN